MIRRLAILTVLGITAMGATAQESAKKYKEIKQQKIGPVMNASAADVWQIVGPGFEDAYKWSTAVDHSVGSGEPEFEGATCSKRSCEINAKGFSDIGEQVIEYSDANRVLAYDVVAGLPGFVSSVTNQWTVVEVGPNQSQLQMAITVRMKPFMGAMMGGMFKKKLNTTIDGVISDLKIYAETGEISTEKKDCNEKLAMAN